ncbi:hypothetical protein NX059_008234 [Plenodomus lindquistii]|nr:hypothetical protein NX059_008234 [Plenodomus lindquistii]
MDVILALAGSHLAIHVDSPPQQLTLVHRHKAIKALEETFTNWPPNPSEEAHCMLATSYLLMLQAGCLKHILSLRGCALLTQLILQHGFIGPFEVGVKIQSTNIDAAFMVFPPFDENLACAGLISCRNVAYYTEGRNAQPIELALLVQVVQMLRDLLGTTQEESRETSQSTPHTTTHASTPNIPVQSTWAITLSPSTEPASTTRTAPPPASHLTTPLHTPSLPVPSLPSARGKPIEHPLLRPPSAPQPPPSLSSIPWATITTPPSLHPEPINSLNAFMSTITILATYPHLDLFALFAEENKVGAVVLAHVLIVRMLVSPLGAPRGWMKNPVRATVDWVGRIIERIERRLGDGVRGGNADGGVELKKCIE